MRRGVMRSLLSTCLFVPAVVACSLPATAARAEELRDFCSDRPGLGTPTCIMDRGHLMVETGIADWSHDSNDGLRSDSVALGAVLLRYGLTDTLEAHVGWDGYSLTRTRDRFEGTSTRDDGGGDMTLALRQSLRNPDGSGFSLAAMPYVTLPTGSDAVSAGDWGAGLLVPVSVEIRKGLSFAVTPEIDAAVDSDGDGRHLAYGSAIGLGISLADNVSMALETSLTRDDDPDGHSTTALAGVALAWQPRDDLQFDIGLVKGLNADSADVEIYTGFSKRY